MLDDLRNSAESGYTEESTPDEVQFDEFQKSNRGPFLGMTAPQRFIVAFFVFLMVAVLGIFILIVFQKLFLPI